MDRKKILIIVGSVVAVLLAAFLLVNVLGDDNSGQPDDNNGEPTQSEDNQNQDGTSGEEASNDDDPDAENGTEGLSRLEAPMLQKSSGNNGPVPAGALINFTCSGPAGADCKIVLTDKNTSEVVTLKKKTLTTTARSGPMASWTWNSEKGSWNVVATVSASGYTSNSSVPQELAVE